MSLTDCLRKVGLEAHESAILAGAAAEGVREGLPEHEAALKAVEAHLRESRAELDDILAQVDAQVQLEPRDVAKDIERRVFDQVRTSGFTPASARLYAQVFRSFYESEAARFAGDAAALSALDEAFDKLTIRAGSVDEAGAVATPSRGGVVSEDGAQTFNADAGPQRRRLAPEDVGRTVAGGPPAPGWVGATRIRRGGRPGLAFRGSRSGVRPENWQQLGSATGHPSSGLGIFFSDARAEASRYGETVDEVYLDIRKPYVIRVEDLPGFNSTEEAAAYAEQLQADGYDGLVITAKHLGGQVNLVAFTPEQVLPARESGATTFEQGGRKPSISAGEALKGLDARVAGTTSLRHLESDLEHPDRKTVEVAKQLQEESLAALGGEALTEETDANVEQIAKAMAAEARWLMSRPGSGADWYRQAIARTHRVVAVKFPEIMTDDLAAAAFNYALAVTSNGQDVLVNVRDSLRVYQQYKDNGGVMPDFGVGERTAKMKEAFALWNEMVSRMGLAKWVRFLNSEFTVSELQAMGFQVSGELADTILPGSVVIGPKIGGAFFANLQGNFDVVTMDLWWMRSWGRYTGDLVEADQEKVAPMVDKFLDKVTDEELAGVGFGENMIAAMRGGDPDLQQDVFNAAHELHREWAKKDADGKTYSKATSTPGKQAARNLDKLINAPKASPTGGGQRSYMRRAATRAVDFLRGHGLMTALADMQAVLWYGEKALYGKLGARETNREDFAGGAAKVLRDEGHDEKAIDAALRSRGTGRRGGRGGAVGPHARPGVVRPQRTGGTFGKRGRRGFVSESIGARLAPRYPGVAGPAGFGPGPYRRGSAGAHQHHLAGKRTKLAYLAGHKLESKKVELPDGSVGSPLNLMKASGASTPEVFEYEATPTAAAVFHERLLASHGAATRGTSVEVKDVSAYEGMRLFMTKDGGAGFALDGDNIVSVFNHADSPHRGIGQQFVLLAVQAGGRRLDAFDGPLPFLYGSAGFRAVSRVAWNDRFAPEGWDKEYYARGAPWTRGKPDVVLMVYDPSSIGYSVGDAAANRLKDWDAAERLQRAAVAEVSTGGRDVSTTFEQAAAAPSAPVFFSQLTRVLEERLPGKGTGASYRQAIESYQRKGAFKAEELEWVDLLAWLDSAKDEKLTKEQVLEYLNANNVQVEEVVAGNPSPLERYLNGFTITFSPEERTEDGDEVPEGFRIIDGQQAFFEDNLDGLPYVFDTVAEARSFLIEQFEGHHLFDIEEEGGDDTKFHQYTLPGGENYRELKLTLPSDESVNDFQSGHFKEPNIVAHVRFNERTDEDGKRMLFIEEVQSDWHQQGRKVGYRSSFPEFYTRFIKNEHTGYEFWEVREKNHRNVFFATAATEAEALEKAYAKWARLAPSRNDVSEEGDGRVPDAPFKQTWPMLVMKRMLRYAAENGFERVGWTTGEQQAARYNLSKHVKEVHAARDGSGKWDVQVRSMDGGMVPLQVGASDEKLSDLVGKDLADKIIAGEGEKSGDWQILRGQDLVIGGTGMKKFYDQMLRGEVNKYAKKWGAKTTTTQIEVPQEVDGGVVETVHAIDVTPAMREAVLQGQPLFQEQQRETPRASIQFGAGDGQTIIRLFEGRDLSSLLHEAGHFFLETRRQIMAAADPGMLSEQAKADWEATLKWMGVKPGEAIQTRHHEKFARGFEAYLMEGKAPSSELARAFRAFRSWLVRIYREVKALRAPLSKEMRSVFDRMLATDEAIEALKAQPVHRVDPGVAALLTKAEQADYLRRTEAAVDRAKERLLKKALRAVEREKKAWWKAERAKVQAEVERGLDGRPVWQALHYLRTGTLLRPLQGTLDEEEAGPALPQRDAGPVKLDRKAIVSLYGERALAGLPRGLTGKDGVPPDVVAQAFGFGSGERLLRAIRRAGDRKKLVEAMTDRTMVERHGDPLHDGTLEAEALASIEDDERTAKIAFELQAIHRETGGKPATRERFKARAEQLLADMTVDDAISADRFYRDEVKAARQAGKALGAKDYEKAALWKARELLNHYLYRGARDARTSTTKALGRFKRYRRPQSRKKVKIDEEYRLKAVEILDGFNLGSRLSDAKRMKLTAQAIADWQDRRVADDGAAFVTPEAIATADTKTHFRDLTLAEFQALADVVDNLIAQGTLARSVVVEGKRLQRAEVAEQISESIAANLPEKKQNRQTRTERENRKFSAQAFFYSTLKARTFIRWLDGFKDLGTVHRFIMAPIDKAEVDRIVRLKQVTKEVEDLFKNNLGKGLSGLSRKRVYVEAVGEELGRDALLAVALNWGNRDNRTKLLSGHGWTEAQGAAVLEQLTRSELQFVQAAWDYINGFWPEIAALEKRRSGIVPKKVEADPFTVTSSDGHVVNMAGGYYPLKYDDRLSPAVSDFTAMDLTGLGQQLGRFSKAQTQQGHNEARKDDQGFAVRLDVGPLLQHVSQVVTDLTMGEAIENTWKILKHPKVRDAIVKPLGVNAYKQLETWLKDTAVGGANAAVGMDGIVNGLRAGVSVSVMGFKVSTVLVQFTGLSHSVVALGPKHMLKGFARLIGNGNVAASVRFVYDRSPFMLNRSTTFHRDIYDAMRVMQSSGRIRAGIAKAAFWPIVKAQTMVDIPTWLGAYDKGLEKFAGDEKKAIQFADSVLIQAQGSGLGKDLSGIERGSTSEVQRLAPYVRLFTTFYSYFNVKLNLAFSRTKETNIRKPSDVAALARDYIILFWLEAVIGEYLLQRAPDFDDDDENALWWNTKLSMQSMASTLPLLREVSAGVQGFGASPAGLRGLEEVARAFSTVKREAGDYAEGGMEDIDIYALVRSLNSAGSVVFKYPGAQMNQVLRAMEKSSKGEEVELSEYLLYKPK